MSDFITEPEKPPPPEKPPLRPDKPTGPPPIELPPPVRICANRRTRRLWARKKITEEQSDEVWCAAGFTYSQQLAEKAQKSKPVKTFEEMVPEQYRDFSKVFSKEESN